MLIVVITSEDELSFIVSVNKAFNALKHKIPHSDCYGS